MGDDRWSCSPLLNSATGLRGQESASTIWPEAQLIDTDARVLQTRQSPYGLQQVNGVQRWTHCDYEEEEIQSNLCHVFAATVNVTGWLCSLTTFCKNNVFYWRYFPRFNSVDMNTISESSAGKLNEQVAANVEYIFQTLILKSSIWRFLPLNPIHFQCNSISAA